MLTNTPRDTAEHIDLPASDRAARPSLGIDWRAVSLASRACCCSSRPAVIAIMPPSAGRPHATELLLCGHHYRRSRRALAAAGATVLNPNGARVSPQQGIWIGQQA
jgi:hypothetical protein